MTLNELPPPKGASVDEATKVELTAMLAPIIANQSRHDDTLANIITRLDERARDRATEHEHFMQRFDALDSVKALRDLQIADRPTRDEVTQDIAALADALGKRVEAAVKPIVSDVQYIKGAVDSELSNRNTDIQRLERENQILRDQLEEKTNTLEIRVAGVERTVTTHTGLLAEHTRIIHGDPSKPDGPLSIFGAIEALNTRTSVLVEAIEALRKIEEARQQAETERAERRRNLRNLALGMVKNVSPVVWKSAIVGVTAGGGATMVALVYEWLRSVGVL